MNVVDHTLFLVMLLLSVVSAIGWFTMSTILKVTPKASLVMSLCNVFLSLAFLLIAQRTIEPNYWYWSIPNVLILYAIMAMQYGINLLYQRRVNNLESFFLIIMIAIIYFVISPITEHLKLAAIIFFFILSFLLARLTLYLILWNYKRLHTVKIIALVWPFAFFALLTFMRVVFKIAEPEINIHTIYKTGETWGYMILVVLLNAHCVGIFIGWLMNEITELVEKDNLTGLYNRRRFDKKIALESARGINNKNYCSVIMVDIDFFKVINDSYGHTAGDAVLTQVASTLSSRARDDVDTLSRFGGEEFIVLLPNTDIVTATAIAEDMRQMIAESSYFPENKKHQVTASFGVACSSSFDIKDLAKQADIALYLAKNNGRNRVEIAI